MSSAQPLPVSAYLPRISDNLQRQKRLVLTAEPGAGKSTLVPLHLLREPWLARQKIIMLEPRRVAAKSLAFFLAAQLGEKVGESVGYRIKNEAKSSTKTRLEIVTEGMLTRQIQQDPELINVGLIIFDEFHERNLNSDLGLMLVKEVMSSLRDDLCCLVMSATIDSERISNYLDGASILHCPGRTYPVEISHIHKSPAAKHQLPIQQQVFSAVAPFLQSQQETTNKTQDILVFLPGQGEIKRCIEYFTDKLQAQRHSVTGNWVLRPLYGALTLEQQQQALQPDKDGRQKVIFATNIAETSLTIDGVSVVVDSGLERQMLFDAKTGMSRLETVYISNASATQRSGRAGRLGPGTSIRLWSESQQLPAFQPEEICTTDISQMILNLAEWGQAEFDLVDWITPPPKTHYDACLTILIGLGLMDHQHKLTKAGQQASHLPLSPRLSAVFLSANTSGETSVACELCALLSEKDLLNRYHTSDFSHRLQAFWQSVDVKSPAREPMLNQAVLHQAKQTRRRLLSLLSKNATGENTLREGAKESNFQQDKLVVAAELLLNGYPDLLARSRKVGHNKYLLQNGRGAEVAEDDPLCQSEWLLVLDINAQSKSGRIWMAIALPEAIVLDFVSSRLTYSESLFWDEKSGSAKAKKVASYGAIPIDEVITSDLSREQKQQFLLQQIKDKGLSLLNWTKKCESWLARACWLSANADGFPTISEAQVINSMESWLMPYLGTIDCVAALKKLDVFPLLSNILDWQQQQLLDQEAPAFFDTPAGNQTPIIYDPQQGPIISVQLQALFGLTESPKLAFNNVPLRFELLSPARRPIQTTSDLAGFWQSSYFEVAKEMRGRYPKHRWPENPIEEKAGKSIKARK